MQIPSSTIHLQTSRPLATEMNELNSSRLVGNVKAY